MRHGSFGWYELTSLDPKAALAFHGGVVGWNIQPAGPGSDYTLLQVGDYAVAGVAPPALGKGGAPGWLGYVTVDDVDAAAAKVQALGGRLHGEPADIPGVMRWCAAADPQGARFVLFQPLVPETAAMPRRPAAETQGMFAWSELLTTDWPAAFEFYSALFGWTRSLTIPLGPMGAYQVFAHEGHPIGGMMTRLPTTAEPFWGYYVRVDSVSDAVARLEAAGGSVSMPSHEVPGNRWSVPVRDAQGAQLGFLSSKP